MNYDKKCKWHKSCGYDFCHGEGICPEFEEEMERDAIERAIKALEKQVPQKVKKYKGLNETACAGMMYIPKKERSSKMMITVD